MFYKSAVTGKAVNLDHVMYLDYQPIEAEDPADAITPGDFWALAAVMPDGKSIWLATAPDKAGLQSTVNYILDRQSYRQYIALEPGATVGTYPAS